MELRKTKLQGVAGGLGGLRTGANELERIGGFWEVLLTRVQQAEDRATEVSEHAWSNCCRLVLADQTLDLEAVRCWT